MPTIPACARATTNALQASTVPNTPPFSSAGCPTVHAPPSPVPASPKRSIIKPPPVIAMADKMAVVQMDPEPGMDGEEAMSAGIPAMAVERIRPSSMLVRSVNRGEGTRERRREESWVEVKIK